MTALRRPLKLAALIVAAWLVVLLGLVPKALLSSDSASSLVYSVRRALRCWIGREGYVWSD